jgi:hypothetical protein
VGPWPLIRNGAAAGAACGCSESPNVAPCPGYPPTPLPPGVWQMIHFAGMF